MKTEKTEVQELNLNELEQVNAGWWWVAILAVGAVAGIVHGALSD